MLKSLWASETQRSLGSVITQLSAIAPKDQLSAIAQLNAPDAPRVRDRVALEAAEGDR